MNEAYIVRRGTTQSVGVTQITDLKPNTSRRSLTYDKVPQSGYLSPRVTSETVAVVANVTTTVTTGLAAYLADVLAAGASANGISPANANTMATNLITRSDGGLALTLSDVNTVLAAVVGSTTLTAGNSVGTLADVLKILSGAVYTLPAGKKVQSGSAKEAVKGSFSTTVGYRQLYVTGSLTLSVSEGDLATLISGSKAVVYDSAGAVLS